MKENILFKEETQNTFGGIIYSSDFDTEYRKTHNIASRIVSDWRFDEMCQKNSLARDKRITEKDQEGAGKLC